VTINNHLGFNTGEIKMKKFAFAAVLGVALFAVPIYAQSPRYSNRNFRPTAPVAMPTRTFTAPQIAPVNSYNYLQPYFYNQAYFGTPLGLGGYGGGYNYTRYGVATTPWGLSSYAYGGMVQPNLGLYSPALWGAAYGMPYGIGFGW
jgi:hypothetical protein